MAKREITKEQYERGLNHGRYLTKEDREDVFSVSELFGYGVYGGTVYEENGDFYVLYELGSTCD
ncbi:MAG: hypothetical protein IJ779_03525 [Ruminococcus sp.]|nr:hypothetical protein [Ruminococcus sp.]